MNQQPEYSEAPAVIESITYRHSAEVAALFEALSKAQGAMGGAKKDAINPHYKSKYADLESVWDACREPLAANGLCVMQPVSSDGSPRVTVTTLLGHKSGQWLASDLTMTATQNTPIGIGSAITYGRRYGLAPMVGVAPEDDDGHAASQRPPQQTQRYERDQPPPARKPESALEAAKVSAADLLWQRMKSPKDVLHYLAECKSVLTDITGSDLEYYSVLKRGGIHDLESLKAITMDKARPIVKDMQETVIRTGNMFVTPQEVA